MLAEMPAAAIGLRGTVEQRIDPCARPAVQHRLPLDLECAYPVALPAVVKSQSRCTRYERRLTGPSGLPESYSNQRIGTMYRAVTRNIEVNVEPYYLADRSDPAEGRYRLGLSGDHRQPVGRVRAAAARATGTSPTAPAGSRRCAAPAWSASSRSSTPATATSTRQAARFRRRRASWSARYTMRNARGEMFEVDIPAFSLDIPGKSRRESRELEHRLSYSVLQLARTPPGRTRRPSSRTRS